VRTQDRGFLRSLLSLWLSSHFQYRPGNEGSL